MHSSILDWRILWTEEPGGYRPRVTELDMMERLTPWTAACQASLSFTISLSLLKFMPNTYKRRNI